MKRIIPASVAFALVIGGFLAACHTTPPTPPPPPPPPPDSPTAPH